MAIRPQLGSTMRVLEPAPGVLAFYDGRVRGARVHGEEPNWLDDGAYELGTASYAIVDGEEAIVYDTHISKAHAHLIRLRLRERGVLSIKVVLSHWHLDHIAGNEVFSDCEIIAHTRTAEAMDRNKGAIEAGRSDGAPAIKPLVLPTRTYDDTLGLDVGRLRVELRHVDIHSRDGSLLLIPERALLLAGDALEDTVTYVAEPDGLERHLADLARIKTWGISRILPNHGDAGIIGGGGYGPGFITATERYVQRLLLCRTDERLQSLDLKSFVSDELEAGWITYFAPYEAVHCANVEAACGRGAVYGG